MWWIYGIIEEGNIYTYMKLIMDYGNIYGNGYGYEYTGFENVKILFNELAM